MCPPHSSFPLPESLMEVKKQRLLLMLHPTDEEGEGPSAVEVGVATGAQPIDESEVAEGEGDVIGMKCRAPLEEV